MSLQEWSNRVGKLGGGKCEHEIGEIKVDDSGKRIACLYNLGMMITGNCSDKVHIWTGWNGTRYQHCFEATI